MQVIGRRKFRRKRGFANLAMLRNGVIPELAPKHLKVELFRLQRFKVLHEIGDSLLHLGFMSIADAGE